MHSGKGLCMGSSGEGPSEPSSSSPWCEIIHTKYNKIKTSILCFGYETSDGFQVIISRPTNWLHRPPPGCVTFYHGQLTNSLRFPIPSFQEVVAYFHISLGQLAPNSFRLLCGITIIFYYLPLPFTPFIFYYFFYPRKGKVGVLYFVVCPSVQFLGGYLTSHKH